MRLEPKIAETTESTAGPGKADCFCGSMADVQPAIIAAFVRSIVRIAGRTEMDSSRRMPPAKKNWR